MERWRDEWVMRQQLNRVVFLTFPSEECVSVRSLGQTESSLTREL